MIDDAVPSCSTPLPASTLDVRVGSSLGDAEEMASGNMYLNSSDPEPVYVSDNRKVEKRFTRITIPPGATISNAYIQFQADERSSGATDMTIRVEASGNAQTFSSKTNNISNRPLTTGTVNWLLNPWSTVGASGVDQQTPDISSAIQEIVDQSAWSAGNSLVVIITGTGERVAESDDGLRATASFC